MTMNRHDQNFAERIHENWTMKFITKRDSDGQYYARMVDFEEWTPEDSFFNSKPSEMEAFQEAIDQMEFQIQELQH
jgi:hypothetical protein